MNRAQVSETGMNSQELAALCVDHLRHEEALLAGALSILRAVEAAFAARRLEAFHEALAKHREFAGLIEDIERRRRSLRENLASWQQVAPEEATLSRLLADLHGHNKAALADAAVQVRRRAEELAQAHASVWVHLRIHLDAYRRLLRDLTNTAASSGRYGPAGVTESLDYRPMLLVDG